MPYDFRDLDPKSLPSLALAYDFVSPSYDEVVARLTLIEGRLGTLATTAATATLAVPTLAGRTVADVALGCDLRSFVFGAAVLSGAVVTAVGPLASQWYSPPQGRSGEARRSSREGPRPLPSRDALLGWKTLCEEPARCGQARRCPEVVDWTLRSRSGPPCRMAGSESGDAVAASCSGVAHASISPISGGS